MGPLDVVGVTSKPPAAASGIPKPSRKVAIGGRPARNTVEAFPSDGPAEDVTRSRVLGDRGVAGDS